MDNLSEKTEIELLSMQNELQEQYAAMRKEFADNQKTLLTEIHAIGKELVLRVEKFKAK